MEPAELLGASPDGMLPDETDSEEDDDDEADNDQHVNGGSIDRPKATLIAKADEATCVQAGCGHTPPVDRPTGSRKPQSPKGPQEYEAFYASQNLCSDSDWRRSMDLLLQPLPPAFRIDSRGEASDLLEALRPLGLEPVPWCLGAYRLASAGPLGQKGRLEDKRLNKILVRARRSGIIERQESASMLPGMVLDVEPHHIILDLCAAPGSKTMQVLELMHRDRGFDVLEPPPGLLVANDFKSKRVNRILDRAKRRPAGPLLATCADARRYPNLVWKRHGNNKVRFDRVMCDVPCSGDGTVRKARGLLDNWTPRSGLCHHGDQLGILCRGIELLAPGGLLTYSTCALNPVECEAVVAGALSWAKGMVEVVPIQIPGLQLARGLTTWRVPAPIAVEGAPPGGATYASWEEVSQDERNSGRLRRSMFPPAADAASVKVGAPISEQLQCCGRLLPVHDNGGCFFLALLRRVGDVDVPLRRGDKARVLHNGLEATVRGQGTGKFAGLTRVTFAEDGSTFHVSPEGLERWRDSAQELGTAPLAEDVNAQAYEEEGLKTEGHIVRPVSEADWNTLADFFGLVSDQAKAESLGVQAFAREALVYGPESYFPSAATQDHDDQDGATLCLASESLRALRKVRNPRPALRAAFVRPRMEAGDQQSHSECCAASFPWRPTLEMAGVLATCCTRRVACAPSRTVLQEVFFQQEGVKPEADATSLGVDPSWPDGAVIIIVGALGYGHGLPELAIVGTLSKGRVRVVFQHGFNTLSRVIALAGPVGKSGLGLGLLVPGVDQLHKSFAGG
eukprot:CAMPEP_0177296796 /NCGR_PEP_ID=MMETSP0368-20130122/2615_1 /TAXON_ID=447022 ORGANISM="Scrippsiella hangoei-like, Strain SHHI-4" /NCGR_SAMPLE_ID=MMETSP0368 /ASSEMBLY_ACC=CAM_ASM_000363 /LENGTH=792 /DNA_ID=CAMNT_0018754949 /DNA_START=1 /DNA_END=2375 /DNA_ORIENTATION=+